MTDLFDLFSSTYGLVLLLGIVLATALFVITGALKHEKLPCLVLTAVLSLVLGPLCSRVYYIVTIELLGYGLRGSFFTAQPYDYAFCGAMLGVMLACWLAARVTRMPAARTLNAAACPGLVLITVARIAECWSDFGWGPSLSAAWMQRMPFGIKDAVWGEWHFALFFLEALYALALCVVLALKKREREDRFFLALIWWSMAQVFFESFRIETLKWGFVRVQQVQCAVFVACVMLACTLRCRGKGKARTFTLSWVCYVLGVALVVLLEFALDKFTWPRWLDYILMALVLTGMALAARKAVSTARKLQLKEDPT